MSNYKISRQLLAERFKKGGATIAESDQITSAIFSYLELAATTIDPLNMGQLPVDLIFYDFRFLYSLYTDDNFARRFFSVFRDTTSKLIEFSQEAVESDHIIRESTGLNNGDNGLYLYILNFSSKLGSAKLSIREVFLINNPGESVFSQSLQGSGSRIDIFKSAVVPRTDDRLSYTDSVMNATPTLNESIVPDVVLPDHYKNVSAASYNEIPFMNGQPGTKASSAIQTSSSGVVKPQQLKEVKINNNYHSNSVINQTDTIKYPVLDFLLKRSRVKN
jgi:hypothetical protein